MILNKEKGKRMWGGSGGSDGNGGGGINPSELAGYATQAWVEGSFVAKAFWNQVFEIRGTKTTTVGSANPTVEDYVFMPNELPATTTTTEGGVTTTVVTAITNIKAKVGLWSPSYISALGQNASGGGGGGSLNEPLLSINNSGLSAPGASQNGMTIVWDNATQKWKYGSAGGGGGVTSITAGTGLSGGTITGSGTIAINSTYQTYIGHGETAYGWGNHASAGYATQTWVGQQGFLTQNAADSRYVSIAFFGRLFQAKNGNTNVNPNDTTSTIDSIKALFGFWTDQYISALGQNSGGGGGGVSLNEPLSSINTSNMIAPTAAQNGMTIVWDNAASKWKYGAVGSSYTLPLAANGTRGGVQIGFTTDGASRNYAVLLSNEKAYVNVPWTDTDTWRPVQDNLTSTSASDCLSANQGKVLKGYIDTLNGYFTNGSAKTALKLTTARTIWGQSFDGSANVSGNMSSVGSITMSSDIWMNNGGAIRIKDNGGTSRNVLQYQYNGGANVFSIGFGPMEQGHKTQIEGGILEFVTAGSQNTGLVAMTIDENGRTWIKYAQQGLRIGDGLLTWDSVNNAIKVERVSGNSVIAGNFYATGAVSALGMNSGSSGSIDTLKVNTAIQCSDSGISFTYRMLQSLNPEEHKPTYDPFINLFKESEDQNPSGPTRNYYPCADFNYMVLRGRNGANLDINWWINSNGNAKFNRVYLSSTVYLYTDGSNVKVNIGDTNYTLTKS